MTNEQLAKHPGIAWAFRLAELEGHPGDRLMVYCYTKVHDGNQHIEYNRLTSERVRAEYEATEAMRQRARELTRELDEAGLLDWSLCDE